MKTTREGDQRGQAALFFLNTWLDLPVSTMSSSLHRSGSNSTMAFTQAVGTDKKRARSVVSTIIGVVGDFIVHDVPRE